MIFQQLQAKYFFACVFTCVVLLLFNSLRIHAAELDVMVVDGDPAPGDSGTIQLSSTPPLIDNNGKIYFWADIPEGGAWGLKSILASSAREQLETLVMDQQNLPAFPAAEPQCSSGGKTCQVYLNSSSNFYVSASGKIILKVSRDDGLGVGGYNSINWLTGSENTNLAPLIADYQYDCWTTGSVLGICPFANTDLPLISEKGLYQIGSFFGTAAYGQANGLSDYAALLIGNDAPSLSGTSITQIYASYVAVDGVDIGAYFSQNDDGKTLFATQLSNGSYALYLSGESYHLLAQTGLSGSVPGIGGDAEFQSITFYTTVGGTTGKALINKSGYGLFAGQWINSKENYPRYGVWRINQDASVTLVASERIDNADPVFRTSEWANTRFSYTYNQFLGLRLAPNGDIYFAAKGNKLDDSFDEVAGLWLSPADNSTIQLLYQNREANEPLRPGTTMPDGGVFEGITTSMLTIDESGHLAFPANVKVDSGIKQALYAEDSNGTLQRIAMVGDTITIDENDIRTLADIELSTEAFINASSGSYRNGKLVFLANFEDGSRALISTGDTLSSPPGPKDGEGSAASFAYSGDSNDPVNTFNGELFTEVITDIDLGGPMPLRFQRYYASKLRLSYIVGDLGSNCLHNFDMRLHRTGNTMTYVNNKGRVVEFLQDSSSGDWTQTSNLDSQYQLLAPGAGDARLFDSAQKRHYTFDFSTNNQLAGKLIKIEDGKGNEHTLTYDSASAQLQTVSDGLGRTLTFTYNTDLIAKIVIVSDGSRSVNFAYTDLIDSEYLTRVIDVLGGETIYAYQDTSSVADHALLLSTTRPRGNIPYTQTYYDTTEQYASGRVATQTDSEGNSYIFEYVNADTTITDPLGNTRVHSHTSDGQFVNRKDETGQSFSLGYDETGKRKSITDRLGDTTSMTYHGSSGQLDTITNAEGATTSNSYTARDFAGITVYDLTDITHADGSTESIAYDSAGNAIAHTDQIGNSTGSTYNDYGQPLTTTNLLGGTTAYSYNADATQATITDPANNTTRFDYDALKRPILISSADGSSRAFTYNNLDQYKSITDGEGYTSTMDYDANSNLIATTDALNHTSSYTYDDNDRLLSSTDPLGNTAHRSYQSLGKLASTRDENANTTNYSYDNLGRLVSTTDPLGNVWSQSYDAEAILNSTTDPLGNTTNLVSDSMGRIIENHSPLGYVSKVSYDALGRIATMTDPLNNISSFDRDPRGLIVSHTVPEGITASYQRNALGMITQLTDPNGNKWLSDYNNQGLLTSRTDPLGSTMSIAYDNRNRPSMITYPGSLGTLNQSYDLNSNLQTASYSDGTTLNYSYDANNRLLTSNGISLSYDANGRVDNSNGIGIDYDPAGRLSGITLAPGKTINYSYDAADRLIQISDWAGGITTFDYDKAGRLNNISRPNSINTKQTWDADSRLIGISEASLSSISLTRNARGEITLANRDTVLPASIKSYASQSHSFDAASQNNQYSYDAMGRLLDDGIRTYTWNLASRLSSSNENGVTSTFTYDASGNRLSHTLSGNTRLFVWNYALDLPSITVEKEAGEDLRYFIHTPAGKLLYSIGATDNSRWDYHYDELGNTQFLTNSTGAVIASYAYSPYGKLLDSTGNIDNSYTWQGQYGVMQQGTSNLYYLRARYYHATTRRFISRDPIKAISPMRVNPYQYALGNPTNAIDPTGLIDFDLEDAVGVALGVIGVGAAIASAPAAGLVAAVAGLGIIFKETLGAPFVGAYEIDLYANGVKVHPNQPFLSTDQKRQLSEIKRLNGLAIELEQRGLSTDELDAKIKTMEEKLAQDWAKSEALRKAMAKEKWENSWLCNELKTSFAKSRVACFERSNMTREPDKIFRLYDQREANELHGIIGPAPLPLPFDSFPQ